MADTNQILRLAAIIREVDGTHSKGAAALAESIFNHPDFRAALADEPPEPIPPAALPEGYIDPEHSGDDRALLQTFYSACLAEGGTADEITLRGLRAVLARWGNHVPAPPADGEVAELVAWLRETGDTIQPSHLAEHQRYKRAAELLQQMEDLAADAVAGLRYIEESCGRLYGVGWDRVYGKADRLKPAHALPLPEAGE